MDKIFQDIYCKYNFYLGMLLLDKFKLFKSNGYFTFAVKNYYLKPTFFSV